MTVFWDFEPCSVVGIDRLLRGSVVLTSEAVSTSETSVTIYETTRRSIPEDSHLHTRDHENLIPHRVNVDLS
jgi:hypothetical protein